MNLRELLSRFGTLHLTVGMGLGLGLIALIFSLFPSEPLELPRLTEVPAGQDLPLSIQGEAGSKIELKVDTLSGNDFKLSSSLDSDGQVQITVPGQSLELAGEYTLQVDYGRHLGSQAVSETFSVAAGAPSAQYSQVQLSDNTLSPDKPSLLRVLLLDAFKNPVSGHSVQVSSTDPSVTVTTTEFVSNEKGEMHFSLQGGAGAPVSLQFYDATLGQPILSSVQIASSGAEMNSEVALASESGPISDFVITGLDSSALAGDTQSVTVRAVDADGFTVTDYTGTVRFSSSDDKATLPNDYTFLGDDLGEHTFSLGAKFITPGSQTLTVTDIDQTSVNGEAKTTVTTSSQGSDPSYDANFQTTDFQREGDFVLVSPASGSYSSSTVEIQGQAEYGYLAVIMLNDQEAGRSDVQFDNSFTYTLQDLADGSYELYVQIQDQKGALHESSKTEKIVIDTTPPTLVSATLSAATAVAGSSLELTVLSEVSLDQASAVVAGQVYPLNATNTPGKYQGSLVAPATPGEVKIDLLLSDALGNEAQYRNQLNFTVTASTEATPSNSETPPTPVEATPSAPSLAPVTGLMATPGEGRIALSWEAPESPVSLAYYRVYYGPYPDALYAVSETFDASTQWTIKDLEGGVPYYFSVAAVDVEATEGPRSTPIAGTPGLVPTAPLVPETPVYPVQSNLTSQVHHTPETGPDAALLLGLSGLGASAWAFFRKLGLRKP